MQIQRINITIPYPVLRDLQESIPFGKRSKFISEAILGRLGRAKGIHQRFKKSLKENKELYNQVKRDWEITEFETWPR